MSAPAQHLTPNCDCCKQNGLFWSMLLLIGFLGLILRLYVGQRQYISFDEWQHVFIAGSARWADLFFEVRTNAHPPLFFVLLRGLLRLGHAKLLYRSISIAAGVGSIVLIGFISQRIFRSRVLPLLCAAAFAFSTTAIVMSVEVRSYQLTIFLVLLAFHSYLPMLKGPQQRTTLRPYVTFSIASTLAVCSQYFAIFFLGACLAILPLLAVASNGFRRRILSPVGRKFLSLMALSFLLPSAAFIAQYFTHLRRQPVQGYLYEYYWGLTPNEALPAFLVRNCRTFFNLFSPVELRTTTVFVILLGTGTALLCILAKTARNGSRVRTLSGVPVVIAIVVTLELLVSSLLGTYPFGGLLRHQYIAAPFLLLAAFVVLDRCMGVAGRLLPKQVVAGVLGAAILVNLVVRWPRLIVFPGAVILTEEFNTYASTFPGARAVYLDRFGVIGYFAHTDDGRRCFVRHITDAAIIDEFRIVGGKHDGTLIFCDKTRDNISLSDTSVYQSFANCLRQAQIKELTLFLFTAGGRPFEQAPGDLANLVRENAARQGVAVPRLVVGQTAAFSSLRLQ